MNTFEETQAAHIKKQMILDKIEKYKAEIRALEKSNVVEVAHEFNSNSIPTRTFFSFVEPADQFKDLDAKESINKRLKLTTGPEAQLAVMFVEQLIMLKQKMIASLQEVFIGKREICPCCAGEGSIVNEVDDQAAVVICPQCIGDRTIEVNG
jgi:hypothetical protein